MTSLKKNWTRTCHAIAMPSDAFKVSWGLLNDRQISYYIQLDMPFSSPVVRLIGSDGCTKVYQVDILSPTLE